MNLIIMNKTIFVIIAIAVIIGIGAVVVSSNSLDNDSESVQEGNIDRDNTIEPKSFTVGLDESVGFSEKP